MKRNFDPKRAIDGTWGEMYLDGEQVRETTAMSLKIQMNFLDVPMCGTWAKQQKNAGWTGNGSVTMTKTNSRMALLLAEEIKAGRMPEFTIISALKDKDAFGYERVVVKGVQFSELTLADWSSRTVGEVTLPFTFTDFDFLDMIEPQ